MSGTVAGGRKAAATNKIRNGEDFYSRIGKKGGQRSRNGGFASKKVGADGLTGKERAAIAGAKGGRISRRGPEASPRKRPVSRASKVEPKKEETERVGVWKRLKNFIS